MAAAQIASDLGCQVDNFPFVLGILLGGRILDCSGWDPIMDLFMGRLSHWKCRHISIEGRLTFINFVLCSISVYSLSVRVLHVSVQNSLHSIMNIFFWGGGKGMYERRKLYFVNWQTVTRQCDRGGLWISNISSLNTTLIAKWIYRYANDRNHIWRKIALAKSGSDPNIMLLDWSV